MKPYVLVHETPKGVFSPPKTNDIVYYHSPRGYMTYELFYKIVSGVFVEYVENVRRSNGFGRKKGCFGYRHHISRFTLRTVDLLMEHNNDLVVLPSHTSHVA